MNIIPSIPLTTQLQFHVGTFTAKLNTPNIVLKDIKRFNNDLVTSTPDPIAPTTPNLIITQENLSTQQLIF
jgi:hypothetical protein